MDSVPTYDDRQLAVAYAVEALKTGRGVTGRVVAELYDRSERWGRMRVSEARTALQSEGIDVPRPTPIEPGRVSELSDLDARHAEELAVLRERHRAERNALIETLRNVLEEEQRALDAGYTRAEELPTTYHERKRGLPSDGSSPADWAAHVEETDIWYCHLCGSGFAAGDEIHWDHRDPVTGGTAGTVVANMSPAHSACNTARGNVPLAEWHTRIGLPDGIV